MLEQLLLSIMNAEKRPTVVVCTMAYLGKLLSEFTRAPGCPCKNCVPHSIYRHLDTGAEINMDDGGKTLLRAPGVSVEIRLKPTKPESQPVELVH